MTSKQHSGNARKFVTLSNLIDEHFVPSGQDSDLADAREAQVGKLRQTIRWFHLYLQSEPTLADLDKAKIRRFYRFLCGQGFVNATISQHRKSLETIWKFAEETGLMGPCPELQIPANLKPKKNGKPRPGTLDHFFHHSFVPTGGRCLSHTRRKRFRRVLKLWTLFHGTCPPIDQITPRHLDQFREFVGTQPRHTYAAAHNWVRLIRELLHGASPEKWPPLKRKNAAKLRPAAIKGTLRHFYETVYCPIRLVGASEWTLSDYRHRLNVFEDYSGPELPIDQINDELLSAFFADRLKTNAQDTVNGYRRILLAVIAFARRKGLTEYQPCVPRLKTPKREPECWSLEEMRRIIDAASNTPGLVGPVPAGKWWPALILFVYNCGTRISATMGVPSNRLDLERGSVFVPAELQKQRADQRFDLLPETVKALRAIEPDRNECIFDDWPYDRTQPQFKILNSHLKRILRRAGLPHTRRDMWHKIRRTFGTMAAAHAGKAYASEMLGHSSVRITEAYLDTRFLDRPSLLDALPSISTEQDVCIGIWNSDEDHQTTTQGTSHEPQNIPSNGSGNRNGDRRVIPATDEERRLA